MLPCANWMMEMVYPTGLASDDDDDDDMEDVTDESAKHGTSGMFPVNLL